MARSVDSVGWSQVTPKRLSLVLQTVDILKNEISRCTWEEWLPSERALSHSLKISRPTLRGALKHLQADGVIKVVQSVGNRIVPAHLNPHRRPLHTVHLLCSDPVDRVRLQANLWTDELRNRLFQSGTRLVAHHGRQYLNRDPEPALERLVAQHPDGCWILAHSTAQIQAWFNVRSIPCLVAGYTHPGIDLPFVSIDMEAVCRRAVHAFVESGHTRIGFVHLKSKRARDVRSTLGFKAGIEDFRPAGVSGEVVTHDGDRASITSATRKLIHAGTPATAILTGTAFAYASVATFLMHEGVSIPALCSLISREHEPFLDALVPAPSCFGSDPVRYGRLVHARVSEILEGTLPVPHQQLIIPAFHAGKSTK